MKFLKNQNHDSKQLFNNLSFKEKLIYIKDYYFLHIAAFVAVILLAYIIISPYLEKSDVIYDFHIASFDNPLNNYGKDNIIKDFNKNFNDEKKDISFNLSATNKYKKENYADHYIGFSTNALLNNNEVDILFLNQKDAIEYKNSLLSLNQYLESDKIKQLTTRKDSLSNSDSIYAINISNTDFAKKYFLYFDEDIYIAINKNNKNIDLCLEFLEFANIKE